MDETSTLRQHWLTCTKQTNAMQHCFPWAADVQGFCSQD